MIGISMHKCEYNNCLAETDTVNENEKYICDKCVTDMCERCLARPYEHETISGHMICQDCAEMLADAQYERTKYDY